MSSRKWRINNLEKSKKSRRKSVLKQKYGLTPERVEEMLEEQGGKCGNPGCPITDPGKHTWRVDHDHVTGKVRGLLCNGCNAALGGLYENPNIIQGLVEYLHKYADMSSEGVKDDTKDSL